MTKTTPRRFLAPLLILAFLLAAPGFATIQTEDHKQTGSLVAAWNGSGTAPANSQTVISAAAGAAIGLQVSGTWVGTLQFEGLIDEVNGAWFAVNAYPIPTGPGVTSATANGQWTINMATLRQVRVRCSAFTSGTILVTLNASSAPVGSGPTQPVVTTSGNLTNNNAAPGATNIGVLPALANAAAPTFTEGNQTLLSVTLGGALRANTQGAVGAGVSVVGTNPNVLGVADSGNLARFLLSAQGAGDASAGSNSFISGLMGYNGATYDRLRTTPGATATTGTGVLGTGPLLWDSVGATNFVKQAGDGSGRAMVVGGAAAGAAIAGNPVLTGGSDGTNARAISTDTGGRQWVRPSSSTGTALLPDPAALADATANPTLTEAQTFASIFNGTTWDRARSTPSVTGTTGTGLTAAGPLLWDLVGTTNFVKQAGDGSGRAMVVGAAAQGAAVVGNPILVAGKDGSGNVSTLPALATSTPADGTAAAASLRTVGFNYLYNGASGDLPRANVNAVVQASTATTVQTINTDITTYNALSFSFHANVTNYNGGTLLAKLQWKDANGLFADIPGATTGALAAGADVMLIVGKGTWPANATPVFYANFPLPRTIRLVETIGTATVTFSAAYELGTD